MMVSLRWVIFINFGLTFFFLNFLAILKKKAGGKRPFF